MHLGGIGQDSRPTDPLAGEIDRAGFPFCVIQFISQVPEAGGRAERPSLASTGRSLDLKSRDHALHSS